MTKQLTIFIFFLLCFIGTLCSCGDDEIKLTRSHRKVIDSLVQERRTAIKEELDSLCDLKYTEELEFKTDSIVKERMAEIRKKIEADAK